MMRYPHGRDPFAELRQMFEALGDLRSGGEHFPPVDIRVEDEQVVLTAELPGVRREDLTLDVEGRHLLIRGEKPAPADARVTWRSTASASSGRSSGPSSWASRSTATRSRRPAATAC